jgi:hypothetical protein
LHNGGNFHIFAQSRYRGGLACLTQICELSETDIQCAAF